MNDTLCKKKCVADIGDDDAISEHSHRVIATGGTLGGFKGKIARRDGEGITLAEKRALLRKEGVKLEGDGFKLRVLGTPFAGFV